MPQQFPEKNELPPERWRQPHKQNQFSPSFSRVTGTDVDVVVTDQAPIAGVEDQDPGPRGTLVDGANQFDRLG